MLQLPRRLQSIDVFRAVTMFLMIFVNDVDGVKQIPEWIKHVEAHADGLGFADTIFPAFLFIVGLSIPFALNKRMQSGESKPAIAWHIILRSLALIVMGFFHVNLESYNHDAALLPRAVWEILITIAFFLTWLDYKLSVNKIRRNVLQIGGIVLLIAMAILYKGDGRNDEVIWMRAHWWGILGLIGWAYLTCALIYLFTNGKFAAQIIALLFFLAFNIANQTAILNFAAPVLKYCWFLGNGSECALIAAGIVISVFYRQSIQNPKNNFIAIMLAFAVSMLVFGFLIRPLGGISKIHATPAWVGICIGISTIVFALLIYIVDVKSRGNVFNIIKPAGTSTLTCYLIPYILYSLLAMFHIKYPEVLSQGIGGILRSFAIAFIVIFITGFLEKKNIRLKI